MVQKSLFEEDNLDNQKVIEKDRDNEFSKPKLDYSIGISQNTQSEVVVTVTIPTKSKLDLGILKEDMKVACDHICMLVMIRDREAENGNEI